MELSRFTDYAMRVLIYTAARSPEKVTLRELADAYRVSHHHLVKIVHKLGALGYLRNQRGRTGGIYIGRPPASIRLGDVIRHTETHFNLVECFNPATDTCRISPVCRLKGIFNEAGEAFLGVMDNYTLADLVSNRVGVLKLLPAHPPLQPALP